MYAFWFGFLDDLIFQKLLGEQLLQATVLALQVLQAFRLGHAYAAELASPKVVRGFAEAVFAAQLLDRHARLGFPQEA
jgi:hypothetical protein